MPALNRVQLIGYLGKDPESRLTPTGKKVTNFSLGVTQHWKSDGKPKETTDWFNIEAWERLGEICDQYLRKGSLVFIEGRLKIEKYEVNGETRFSTKVIANQLQILNHKDKAEPEFSVEEDFVDYDA